MESSVFGALLDKQSLDSLRYDSDFPVSIYCKDTRIAGGHVRVQSVGADVLLTSLVVWGGLH